MGAATWHPLVTIALRGPGGEPVSWRRTLNGHGLIDLPPLVRSDGVLEATLPVPGGGARTVRVRPGRRGALELEAAGRRPGRAAAAALEAAVRHMLRLEEDLSPFYARIAEDPDLGWAAAGAGRLLRSPTVFEDVVKTICTTNCAWSGTERMVGALVEHLGVSAPGAPEHGSAGRTFPTPAAMAAAPESFYRDTARAGYRGAYLQRIAADVAAGELDLEALARAPAGELPDADLRGRLEELPGVGPYASAHIMLLSGRHAFLVLDSWTRPTYARHHGRQAADRTIERRFRRYGPWAGLAFWLYVTRDWVDDAPPDLA